MTSSRKEYNYTGRNFVIENNILKGERKEINFDLNFGKVLLKHLRNKPDHVAQIDAETEKQTNYSEMRENLIRCALWLQKHCIGKGDVIMVCTHNNLDAYIPCFATLLVGAIFSPCYHEVDLKMAKFFMNLIKPKIIFVCECATQTLLVAARSENLNPTFVVIGKEPELHSLKDIMELQTITEVEKFEPVEAKGPTEIAMIFFTSGTTGLPKGIAHSYDMLLGVIGGSQVLPMQDKNILWYSSMYWITGTYLMIQSLINYATRIIHTNTDPEETCKIIERFKVNSFYVTPCKITHFYKSNVLKNYKLEPLKNILTIGAKVSREILQDIKNNLPHVTLVQGYGMTETAGLITMQTNDCKVIESVGFVYENTQLKIVDIDTGKSLGPNQPGEGYVKLPNTAMIRYYKDPDTTRSSVDEEGWIKTGDQLYYTEEGEVIFCDRIKEIMRFRGHYVSPFELEEILQKHPAVIEAAVVPIPHELDIERPIAFVKKAPGSKVSEEELVNMTSELGEFKRLSGGVKFLEEMPYTANGKICRKDLKAMAKALSHRKIYDRGDFSF